LNLKTEKIPAYGPPRKGIPSSDVPLALHFGSTFIQNLPATDTVEMGQQILNFSLTYRFYKTPRPQ